ncbi:MAG: hypothetical protein JWO37_27 [Acidimicrobiales bacterium]|jgi:hypothetical protein|nr:hypothetical protein [Acidimicrobiales bacterium]
MTFPLADLAFWSPGDPGSAAIDALLCDGTVPLARHGLTGIARRYADETGAALHPAHRAWVTELDRRSIAVDGALTEVVPALRDAEVEFFLAKGPALAYTVYPDPSMRPYSDLDVYVCPTDRLVAAAALRELGYQSVVKAIGPLGGLSTEMHGGRFGAIVELHGHPVDNADRQWVAGVGDYLPEVQWALLCGVETPVLSPAAHSCIQAIHAGAGHRYSKLVLYRDLDSSAPYDLALAARLGARPHLEVALAVVDGLRGRPDRSLRRRRQRWLTDRLVKQDPARWDEFEASVTNVLALTNRERITDSLQLFGLLAASAVRPRRTTSRRARITYGRMGARSA